MIPQSNATVAEQFEETADLLALTNANPFRIRAYQNAARTIRSLETPLPTLMTEPNFHLDDLPGIGRDLASKVTEILHKGSFRALDTLRSTIPTGMRELMQVPGLGPKKTMLLHSKRGINSLQDLELAIKAGQLRDLKGFGQKSIASLARALAQKGLSSGRMLVDEADDLATNILLHLSKLPDIEVVVAGSLRRGLETVGDLDFVATGQSAPKVFDHLKKFDTQAIVLSAGSTRMSLRLKSGRQIDIRVINKASFGSALLYFTGSKSHNIELRRLAQAQNLKLSEYGLFDQGKRIAGASEDEIYQALGLASIPPELREGRGEVSLAAKDQLPSLVNAKDILGDFHLHTTATDGVNTIREMAHKAQELGYAYIAITDHSERVRIAHGLSRERLARQWAEIDKIATEFPTLRILKGIEVDILDDGAMDLSKDFLKAADWVVAAVHYGRNQSRATMTKRIIRAISSGVVHALAHPSGRLLTKRPELSFDLNEITKAACDYHTALEINGQPQRLDLNDKMIEIAARHPVEFVLATDSHSVAEFDFMKFALKQARRGGLSKDRIVNCRPFGAH